MTKIDIATDKTNESWNVELVSSKTDVERGLRYHTKLEAKTGMLFIFKDERLRTFNTVGMNFPIDILFMDSEGYIVSIVKNVKPGRKAIMPPEPAKYVLEIPAGEASEYKIELLNRAILPS